MLGIAIRLESHQGVSEMNDNVNMLEFFSTQVFPELQDTNHSNRPMVKATALKFICTFRKQFTREQLISLLPLLISHLGSPSIVVHTLAAYGIERILMTREGDHATGNKRYKISHVELQPLLESLFTGLFQIVENTELNENEHVMKCTMRALSRAGEDVIPITGIVFNKLAAALERVCKNPRNPSYNHYLFESIAALVRNVCSKDPSQTAQLETLLFPPFQTVLQLDILEFTPYVFQVLAQLLEYRPAEAGLGDAYTGLFQPLLTVTLWERKGNVPGLVRLLTAYLKKAAAELVAGGHLIPLLGIFQKLIASKVTEAQACELVTAITIYVPKDALGQYLKTIFQLMLTKLQQGKSNRYPVLATQYFALFAGLYGGQAFFDYLNQISPAVALHFLAQVWIPKAKNATQNRIEAKTQVVGLTRLLCDASALLADDNGKQIWAQTFAVVVSILTSNTFSAGAIDDEEPEIEIAYDATFSQLSLATKKADDPFASVADPVEAFTKSVEKLSASQPGVLEPIIQLGLSSDPKLSSDFQSLCQKTGVQL
jgi:exportin-2 (importin alpha re-exporter)